MRPRRRDVLEIQKSFNQNPGPGAYEETNLGPKSGRYLIAKYEDTKLAKINPNS